MKYTSDYIKECIKSKGIEETRKIVYGENCQYEYIGMAKFVDSRMDQCRKQITVKLID